MKLAGGGETFKKFVRQCLNIVALNVIVGMTKSLPSYQRSYRRQYLQELRIC